MKQIAQIKLCVKLDIKSSYSHLSQQQIQITTGFLIERNLSRLIERILNAFVSPFLSLSLSLTGFLSLSLPNDRIAHD